MRDQDQTDGSQPVMPPWRRGGAHKSLWILWLSSPWPRGHSLTFRLCSMTDMEQQWLSETSPEDFFFSAFPGQSCVLRRHNRINGALAQLKFGSYLKRVNRWVPNDDVVWLGMITSDRPGDGARLL